MSKASTKIRSSQSPGEIPDGATFHHSFTDKRGVAERYGVSERTIDNWIRTRRIPYIKAGRVCRFNIARCDAALTRFEVKEVA